MTTLGDASPPSVEVVSRARAAGPPSARDRHGRRDREEERIRRVGIGGMAFAGDIHRILVCDRTGVIPLTDDRQTRRKTIDKSRS